MESTKEIVIPPSPNWYLSSVFECHKTSGVLVYAASRCLVFLKSCNVGDNFGFPTTRVIPDAHRGKITCVSWYQRSEKDNLLLSSAGEDGSLCIWNANDLSLVFEQDAHQEQKISCLSWSSLLEKKILASSSEDGTIIITELLLSYGSCITRKLNYGKMIPLILSFNPHIAWHLAIGCKGGLLYICDIRENRGIIYKLRAHEEDLHNIAWCPVKGNAFIHENESKETFLATTGRDKTIKLWATNEGKCVAQSKLPGNTGVHRPRPAQDDKRSTWVALHWLNERHILSSGLSGELIMWEVGPKMSWKIVHKLHTRGLFNISSYVTENNQEMVWTSAQDRNVILWPIIEGHVPKEVLGIQEMENPHLCLSTMGGYVYVLNVNPIDATQMALGLGDCSIRLWNMAAAKPDMTMLWNGIKGKVSALAWHPTVEGRLAFGTDEGRVGIFDTLAPSKPPLLSRTYHKGTVYNLAWATLPNKNGLFLYSCGGNHIIVHDPSALDLDAKNFNNLIISKGEKNQKFPSRTEFQWKVDFSLLAVGNEDGSVEIYTGRDLSLLMIIVAHKKLIQCLKWHPPFTFQSVEPSKFDNWLAVASNDVNIKVFSVTVANNGEPSTSTLAATLSGHKERVVSLAWSPHEDGKLLSASYDGTAQVWDVINKEPLANFGGHTGRLLCCEWNALEQDTAVTGSDDMTVQMWKMKDQVHKTPAESIAVKTVKERKKAPFKPPTSSSVTGRHTSSSAAAKKKAPSKLKSLFPVSATLEGRGRLEGLKDCKILATLKGVSLKHSIVDEDPKSYTFPISDFGDAELAHLGFFVNRESTVQMLQEEIDHHQEGSNFDLAAHLRIWQGDVEPMLREAVKKRQLNDWLVSLAPQVSLEFWREMAHLYAQQLMAEGDVRKAVSYMLISGEKSQAIEMFSSQQLHREAVALTRCQYPDESSQVQESLSRWSRKAVIDGNLELAVKCFLANGEVAEAARTLARRSDPLSLVLSADLATNAGLDQLAAAYLQQAADIAQTTTATTDNLSPLAAPTNGDAAFAEVSESIDQANKNQEVLVGAIKEETINCDDIQHNRRTE